MFIPDPDPDFLPILDPGYRGQKDTGSGSETLLDKPTLFVLRANRKREISAKMRKLVFVPALISSHHVREG
jgi:hypothetical protein